MGETKTTYLAVIWNMALKNLNTLPCKCTLLFSTSSFNSSACSFPDSTQGLAWVLSGPPLRALQAALSCRIRAGSSRASERPPQVTGGVLRGPHTGEWGGSSGQTPTSRPGSRILRSGAQSPSRTGILTPHRDGRMDGWTGRCTKKIKLKKKQVWNKRTGNKRGQEKLTVR